MVEAGTKFSLLNKKTRNIQILFVFLFVFCSVASVYVLRNFSTEFGDSSSIGKIVVILMILAVPFFIIGALIFPFKYVVTEDGVEAVAVGRRAHVSFSDALSVELEIFEQGGSKQERVIIIASGKKHYFVELAENFDKLRDHIVESVDPSFVVDRRMKLETE